MDINKRISELYEAIHRSDFENKADIYITETNDTSFGQAWNGIKEFIKGKDYMWRDEKI